MRSPGLLIIAMLLIRTYTSSAQDAVSWPPPDTVTFHCGALHLKGWLWMPAGKTPAPAVLFNHGKSAHRYPACRH